MARSRRITLLVMIYVTLDLANPMMPGAVQLVGASLETVAGCQCRTGEIPVPAPTLSPRGLSTLGREPEAPARAPRPPAPVLLTAPPRSCPSLEPGSSPSPSSDDH